MPSVPKNLRVMAAVLAAQRPRRYFTPCMIFLSHGEMASRIDSGSHGHLASDHEGVAVGLERRAADW